MSSQSEVSWQTYDVVRDLVPADKCQIMGFCSECSELVQY